MSWRRIVLLAGAVLTTAAFAGLLWAVLIDERGRVGDAAFAPDGRRVALYSGRDGASEIYVVDLRSGERTRITDNAREHWLPRWSPDGRRLLYSEGETMSPDNGADTELYVVNSDGTGRVRLTHNRVEEWGAQWSPDGSMILYCSGPEEFLLSGHRSHGELFTVTPDGARRTNLSRSAATDDGAGWSPDGASVVFHSDRGGSFDVWSVRADGRQLRRLTRARGDELWPQVGPDGKRLVFQTQHRDLQRIWLLELGGGTPRALTLPHFYARASFAPDGRLALVEDGRVSIVGLNGRKRNVGRADGYLDPVWSPDGRFLAAEVLEEPSVYSPSDVAVIAVGDGRRLRISGRGQFDQFGSWSPDARTLVFVRNGDDVLLADVRSGAVRELDGI